jgi:hypothetical protein
VWFIKKQLQEKLKNKTQDFKNENQSIIVFSVKPQALKSNIQFKNFGYYLNVSLSNQQINILIHELNA